MIKDVVISIKNIEKNISKSSNNSIDVDAHIQETLSLLDCTSKKTETIITKCFGHFYQNYRCH